MTDADLRPLPPQPREISWPTQSWPRADLDPRPGVSAEPILAEVDRLFGPDARPRSGETHAVLAVHRGELVVERYGPNTTSETTLISRSMATRVLHALVGILVREGQLDVHEPAPVPPWRAQGDPRGSITTEHLLRMVDGLDFIEDYVAGEASNVIDMLFGGGKQDVAAYAEGLASAHPPGKVWNYSSGTSNIVSGIAGRLMGDDEEMRLAFMRRELFERIGMRSAKPRFDDAGTFIASSFVFATAQDFARFGLLYLRDGVWDGERLLPAGWVDHARTPTPASKGEYGAHFWLAQNGTGIFHCSGYEGQYIAIDPSRDLVLVRLGKSSPTQRGAVFRSLDRVVRGFALLESETT